MLELKGISYTLKQVNLLENAQNSQDYLKLNPAAVVPALQLAKSNESDGMIIITQSVAIMEYLEETVESKEVVEVLPKDPLSRAKVRQLVQLIAADCQPLQNLHVLRKFRSLANLSSEDEARQLWGRPFIQKALQAYTELIVSLKGKFSVGDSVTMADCCLIPQLYNARRFGIDVNQDFPLLTEIESNFQTIHPVAFKKAHPDNCRD